MKKYLPYAPLAILMIGVISVQLGNTYQTGLLSNTLSTVSGEVGVEICSKPGDFIRENETAWCNIGEATEIEKKHTTWSWSCVVGEEVQKCHFAENVSYPTRGGVLFTK